MTELDESNEDVPKKVADRLSGNGIVKAARICIDRQVVGLSQPTDFEEAKICLDQETQETIDNIYILVDKVGHVEVLPGDVLPEEVSKKIAEEFL